MIRFVLDTDSCIFWLKGHRSLEERILQVGTEQVAISIITACELAYGAWKSQRRHDNLRMLVTNNVAHFRRIPELPVENWVAPS